MSATVPLYEADGTLGTHHQRSAMDNMFSPRGAPLPPIARTSVDVSSSPSSSTRRRQRQDWVPTSSPGVSKSSQRSDKEDFTHPFSSHTVPVSENIKVSEDTLSTDYYSPFPLTAGLPISTPTRTNATLPSEATLGIFSSNITNSSTSTPKNQARSAWSVPQEGYLYHDVPSPQNNKYIATASGISEWSPESLGIEADEIRRGA
ncbi:hypothetical protein BDP27DRAFT_724984 [Rhodocollybia butyracea]|uniref:Uncharacterized protein n=1 Tax=Rhodocollybia butyracea TaxID=206335 RepID=A0A9P5PNX8_9AGAR|nr:hypothetical protein BDP27DRAFT_724984 [Rhodocollybia butyracea]